MKASTRVQLSDTLREFVEDENNHHREDSHEQYINSAIMRLAERMEKLGFSVESFHCVRNIGGPMKHVWCTVRLLHGGEKFEIHPQTP